MSSEADLRAAIVEAMRRLETAGLNQGTSGNVSVRWGDGLLITPSGIPSDALRAGDVVRLGPDGTSSGPLAPSSEWRFHRDILAARPELGAVVHAHPPHATAFAICRRDVPAAHYMIAAAGGPTIRCARYATFGTQALSDHALEALKDRTACLLGQHGQISLGKDLEHALWTAIEVETISRMYVQALTLGEPPVLSDEEMARVIDQMKRMSYGHAPDAEGVNDLARQRASQ